MTRRDFDEHKVLVTGGAGFIGRNLVNELLSNPHISGVTVLDNFSTSERKRFADSRVDFVEGDICSPNDVQQAITGASSVVHLAALPSVPRSIVDPTSTWKVNALGSQVVLETARLAQVRRVLLASSSSVYGSSLVNPRTEDDVCQPVSPYAASKISMEMLGNSYSASFEMEVVSLRFFNVFGRGQSVGHVYAAVVPQFISSLLAGTALTIHGDGLQARDFTSVDFVAKTIVSAILKDQIDVPVLNLCRGNEVTILELVSLLAGVHGDLPGVNFVESRKGDVRSSRGSNLRLSRKLPIKYDRSLFDELTDTYHYYRSLLIENPDS